MTSMKPRQEGIALIQVLLISAIITVFAIYLSQTAKSQVNIARLLSERSMAVVAIHDAESRVLFNLLTKQAMGKMDGNNSGSIAHKTSQNMAYYYGQPLFLNKQTTVRIYDLSGKISVFTPENLIFKPLLLANGLSRSVTDSVTDALLDWQDTDKLARRNGAEKNDYLTGPRDQNIPFLEELLRVKGITAGIYPLLRNNLSEVPAAGFNPIVASEELLAALYPDVVNQLIDLRRQDKLTSRQFQQLTDVEADEWIRFFPSNRYRINIESDTDIVSLTKTMDVEVNLYAKQKAPLKIFSIKWNTQQ